jgi:hypothetical protein
MRIFVLLTILFFAVPNIFLYSQEEKTYSKKKNTSKKMKSGKANNSASTKPDKNEILKEDVRFFHENWAMEETQFPSDSIRNPTKHVAENPVLSTNPNIGKPPLVEPKNKPGSLWESLDEYKKVIFISLIIVVFALYRIRGGRRRSSGDTDRFFTRLKDK